MENQVAANPQAMPDESYFKEALEKMSPEDAGKSMMDAFKGKPSFLSQVSRDTPSSSNQQEDADQGEPENDQPDAQKPDFESHVEQEPDKQEEAKKQDQPRDKKTGKFEKDNRRLEDKWKDYSNKNADLEKRETEFKTQREAFEAQRAQFERDRTILANELNSLKHFKSTIEKRPDYIRFDVEDYIKLADSLDNEAEQLHDNEQFDASKAKRAEARNARAKANELKSQLDKFNQEESVRQNEYLRQKDHNTKQYMTQFPNLQKGDDPVRQIAEKLLQGVYPKADGTEAPATRFAAWARDVENTDGYVFTLQLAQLIHAQHEHEKQKTEIDNLKKELEKANSKLNVPSSYSYKSKTPKTAEQLQGKELDEYMKNQYVPNMFANR